MGPTTETYNARLQSGVVEVFRRVATILQVCSHVLPSTSSFRHTLNVFFFLLRTWNATFKLRKSCVCLFFHVSSVQCCLVVQFLFLLVFVITHAVGSFHSFFCLASPLSGARFARRFFSVLAGNGGPTRSTVILARDCHRQHYHRTSHHITPPLHS